MNTLHQQDEETLKIMKAYASMTEDNKPARPTIEYRPKTRTYEVKHKGETYAHGRKAEAENFIDRHYGKQEK